MCALSIRRYTGRTHPVCAQPPAPMCTSVAHHLAVLLFSGLTTTTRGRARRDTEKAWTWRKNPHAKPCACRGCDRTRANRKSRTLFATRRLETRGESSERSNRRQGAEQTRLSYCQAQPSARRWFYVPFHSPVTTGQLVSLLEQAGRPGSSSSSSPKVSIIRL